MPKPENIQCQKQSTKYARITKYYHRYYISRLHVVQYSW